MEQFSLFVNIADYILHCSQINSFESRDSTRNRFHENNSLLSRRGAHEKNEKCQIITFFAPKSLALIHIPASETDRNKARIEKRSTCVRAALCIKH